MEFGWCTEPYVVHTEGSAIANPADATAVWLNWNFARAMARFCQFRIKSRSVRECNLVTTTTTPSRRDKLPSWQIRVSETPPCEKSSPLPDPSSRTRLAFQQAACGCSAHWPGLHRTKLACRQSSMST